MLSFNNKDLINQSSDLDHWILDLDNTIYDYKLGLFKKVSLRITEYIIKLFNIKQSEAIILQKDMYLKYGLTLRGLIIEKKIDPFPFLEYVHDVNFSEIKKDNELKRILQKIKGQKLIYTNAPLSHAQNILTKMGIFEEFENIFDINDANFIPKPNLISYKKMVTKFSLDTLKLKRSIFFEDTAKNLKPAHDLGITTVWLENKFNEIEAEKFKNFIDCKAIDIKSILYQLLSK